MDVLKDMLGIVTGGLSNRWKEWYSLDDEKRCKRCQDQTGKIYPISEIVSPQKLHPFCRCYISRVTVINAGCATTAGKDGADYWLKEYGELPDYYLTQEELKAMGWKRGRIISQVAPGKMVAKGQYQNRDGHLPSAPGRIWFEADINYSGGFRGRERILYSNDSLIFVTYNHYETFYEIA